TGSVVSSDSSAAPDLSDSATPSATPVSLGASSEPAPSDSTTPVSSDSSPTPAPSDSTIVAERPVSPDRDCAAKHPASEQAVAADASEATPVPSHDHDHDHEHAPVSSDSDLVAPSEPAAAGSRPARARVGGRSP